MFWKKKESKPSKLLSELEQVSREMSEALQHLESKRSQEVNPSRKETERQEQIIQEKELLLKALLAVGTDEAVFALKQEIDNLKQVRR